MSSVVEIYKGTKNDNSYLILNSTETEVSGNLTVLEDLDVCGNLNILKDLDVCGNIYFNNTDLSSALANLVVDLTGGQDASFSNIDISGSLKLNNTDISGKLIQIDASLVELASNSGAFSDNGTNWENTGTSGNQIILKHTSNQFRGINFVDNVDNGVTGLRWWKDSIGSSDTSLTVPGNQKAEIRMGDSHANFQFHNWHGIGSNNGNTDFYGGGDGRITTHRPIMRISPSNPDTEETSSQRSSQRYIDTAFWEANKWGKVMIGCDDNDKIPRPTFALDVRGECNIGDTASGSQNLDTGLCSYRIGGKVVVPALGISGQVLTVNDENSAAEWVTPSVRSVYGKQVMAAHYQIFPDTTNYHRFGDFNINDSLAVPFEFPAGLVEPNGYFRIPMDNAGIYNIRVALQFQGDHQGAMIKINRNDNDTIAAADNNLNDEKDSDANYIVECLYQLDGNDILYVEAKALGGGGNISLAGGETKNFFEIFKIA